MAILVASLGKGKGTWSDVLGIASSPSFEKVFFVTTSFFAERFEAQSPRFELLVVDENKSLPNLVKEVQEKLGDGLSGQVDVAVNLVSGSGKEHMAVLAALLKSGVGIRLVTLGPDDEIVEL